MATAKRSLGQWLFIALGGMITLAVLLLPKIITCSCGERAITFMKIELFGDIKTALGQFEVNAGRFPTTAEGLDALTECPPTLQRKNWHGPYMVWHTDDIWGRKFRYVHPSTRPGLDFELASAGPDGKFDTRDDIANYPMPEPGFMLKTWDWAKDHRTALIVFAIYTAMVLRITLRSRNKRKEQPDATDANEATQTNG